MMPLYVKFLTPTAKLPTRAHADDAGLDLYADESALIPAHGRAWVKTGVTVAVPPAFVGLVWPRSGMAGDGLSVDAGVIDCGYRGEVKVLVTNGTDLDAVILAGQKIAQLLIQNIASPAMEVVIDLPKSGRGENGFGSSGQ